MNPIPNAMKQHLVSALFCLHLGRPALGVSIALTLACGTHVAQAQEVSFSGFGTVGWAQSNQEATLQRFIDQRGTFKRDSIVGGQLDARLSPEWSATVQATVAPSMSDDDKLALQASWAFVSWRPGNDWLLRLGKQRLPLFLHTENRDVGVTYEPLRLPAEVYAIASSTDLMGLSVSRAWFSELGEWSLDAYAGSGKLDVRTHSRDLGAQFQHVKTQATGMALSLKLDAGSTLRASVYHAVTRGLNGQPFPSRFPKVDIPSVGFYYAVDPNDPRVGKTDRLVNDVITVGADIAVAPQWRVVTELARNVQHNTDVGANTAGGYITVLHEMARFTPYVTVARLRSLGAPMRVAESLDAVSVPGVVPQADLINLSQRAAADSIYNHDETSLAVGVSYALSAQSKLKGEWMRTRVGKRSSMVDSQRGQATFNHEDIDVYSLAYNFAF